MAMPRLRKLEYRMRNPPSYDLPATRCRHLILQLRKNIGSIECGRTLKQNRSSNFTQALNKTHIKVQGVKTTVIRSKLIDQFGELVNVITHRVRLPDGQELSYEQLKLFPTESILHQLMKFRP